MVKKEAVISLQWLGVHTDGDFLYDSLSILLLLLLYLDEYFSLNESEIKLNFIMIWYD